MERERLSRLIKSPEQVGRADLADLNDLARRFPWFAGAQLLRTVGGHKAGDVLSEDLVHLAAPHLPSRTVLFDRIAEEPLLKVVHKSPEPLAPAQEPQAEVEEKKSPLPFAPAGMEEPAEMKEISTPVSAQVAEDPIIEPAELITADIVDVPHAGSEATSVEPIPVGPDPLDTLIQQAVKAGAYDITRTPVQTASETRPPEPAVLPVEHIASSPVTRKRSFTDWLNEPSSVEPRPIAVDRTEALPLSVEWMRALDTDMGKTAPTEIHPQGPTSRIPLGTAEPPDTKAARPDAPMGQPPRPLRERPTEPAETVDVIDRFIRQQEPPTLPKAEFYTPQEAAKRSLDDSAGMVTETLAKVYVKQGNLPKAIEAYHKLALKYPEKSAFFAALAKELEVHQHK